MAICLALAACQGPGGSGPPPSSPEQTQPPSTTAPGYPMGPGMRQNFGMMSDNLNQMHQMMGQGYMAPGHYGQTMGMMGQMGTMMHEMGGPSYPPEVEQRHRAQLQEMRERLGAMKSQAAAPGGGKGRWRPAV